MHTASILVDATEVARHTGGYLPFEVDLTDQLRDGRPHVLTLRLDNRENPEVPPGKPYDDLDFCWYGGLYRDAELRWYPDLHITDPVAAGEVAGGGVFVRALSAGPIAGPAATGNSMALGLAGVAAGNTGLPAVVARGVRGGRVPLPACFERARPISSSRRAEDPRRGTEQSRVTLDGRVFDGSV